MKIFSIGFYSESNKGMFARLINTEEPLQIEFWMTHPKFEKTKKIMDFIHLNPFLDYGLEPFISWYGLYTQKSFDILKPLMNIEKCRVYTLWYEQIPFYAVVPPTIVPEHLFQASLSKSEAISSYWKIDNHYFRTDDTPYLYVSEQFKETVLKHKLKGMSFTLKWEGELPV